MERGSSKEEARGPPGEHIEPGELIQLHMDGKGLSLCTQAVDLCQTHKYTHTHRVYTISFL